MADIWSYQETRDSEFARATVGDFQIEVQDFDGDFSEWTIKHEGQIIANGGAAIWNHFEASKAAAWATIHSFEVTPCGYMMALSREPLSRTEQEQNEA